MYKSTSIDNVIAKILRDTRIGDSSYLNDFYEWIPEAMSLMHTRAEVIPAAEDIKINYHMGKLPCGLIYIDAFEYQGKRLRVHNGLRKLGAYSVPKLVDSGVTAFGGGILPTANSVTGNMTWDSNSLVPPAIDHPHEGYQLHLDHVATTFSDGVVRIYFKKLPTDSRGLPLIPDHADYREALYWYVRAKLIQSGYEDPVYGKDDRMCDQRWEKHATRAISDIQYPTPDEKEAQLAMAVRFIPPTDYYNSFFNSTLGEPPMGF